MTSNFERFQEIQKQVDSEDNNSSLCHLEPKKCGSTERLMFRFGFDFVFQIKSLIIVGPGWITLAPVWVPDDIESCKFQNLLIFGLPETSQNLMSFRQLLFSLFCGGDQREKSENPRNLPK